MAEIAYIKSGKNQLSYSCTVPQTNCQNTGIVFVHAADGNRLGPHRMFVEFEENFNFLGYPTLRFDLSGCGDSTGLVETKSIEAEVKDTIEAINFFCTNKKLDSVILFGISRGSLVCFTVMSRYCLPLKGVILLSIPVSTNKAAVQSFSIKLKEYLLKLKNPGCFLRLLRGRVNLYQVWKTLTTAIGIRHRYEKIAIRAFATKCPLIFIFGSKDPLAEESCRYYGMKCAENNIPCKCHFIENANHSFFHYKWKEEILEIANRWIETIK